MARARAPLLPRLVCLVQSSLAPLLAASHPPSPRLLAVSLQVMDPAAAERQVEEVAVKYLQELWRVIEENRRSLPPTTGAAAAGGGAAGGRGPQQ